MQFIFYEKKEFTENKELFWHGVYLKIFTYTNIGEHIFRISL